MVRTVQQGQKSRFLFNALLAKSVVRRDYQSALVDELARSTARDVGRQLLAVVVATGGGKRLIANDFVALHAIPAGKRVLVVTKDWLLLRQLAEDLCQRHVGLEGRATYVGGSAAARHLDGLARSAQGQLVFTTIQTWFMRRDLELAQEKFDLVLIDELHWGEKELLYAALHQAYPQATFIGLTATPRAGSSYTPLSPICSFEALVAQGYLATPVLHEVRTRVAWQPVIRIHGGEISATSLRALGVSTRRNELIVSTYAENSTQFAKTLVFACNIGHADVLAEMFREQGVAAQSVHSELAGHEIEERIRRFRDGSTQVLVNIAMAAHGVDVPDIRTVFLARPTASDILMQQMVGRAARIAPGKDHFFVVDFVDNTTRLGVPVVRPHGFLGTPRRFLPRGPRLERHTYDSAEIQVIAAIPGYEELAGLAIQPRQTFGIEFELAPRRMRDAKPGSPRWRKVAEALLEALRPTVPTASHPIDAHACSKDESRWNVEPDPSCGWEVTTRILHGVAGMMEIRDGCRALRKIEKEYDLRLNWRTSTHVHLAWLTDLASLRRLLKLGAHFEPALLSLLPPSRARSRFCRRLTGELGTVLRLTTAPEWCNYLDDRDARYLALNPDGLFGARGTIEVRAHSGTLDAGKILAWMSLHMLLLHRALEFEELPEPLDVSGSEIPLSDEPRGDIRELCRFLGANTELVEKLARRRAHAIANAWRRSRWRGIARVLRSRWALDESAAPGTPFRQLA